VAYATRAPVGVVAKRTWRSGSGSSGSRVVASVIAILSSGGKELAARARFMVPHQAAVGRVDARPAMAALLVTLVW
jgi:hypothetical protein